MAGKGRIRVGILGQGRSGRNIHANWFTQSPRKYQIVAVSDILKDRRERAEQEYGCDVYADYKDLLKRDDIELVVNALPSFLHPQGTVDALLAGHHVVCEKPLAPTTKDFRRMVSASKKAGKILAPYQQSRYAAHFQQILKVIGSGILGRIVLIRMAYNGYARRWDWQTVQEYKGGNLLNTGPHPMDQALCLLDWKMPQVFCEFDRANTFGDAEDHVKILLKRKGSPTIDLEISSCDAYPGDMFKIYGTQGGLTGGPSGLKWRFFKPSEAPKQDLVRSPLPGPSYCREDLTWHERTWEPTEKQKSSFNFMSKSYYDHLYKVLRDGAPLFITPEQVGVQAAVMEECHKQAPLSKMRAKGWTKGS
ncbi:MAG: Gfo/Idh/MocA family oxidoreductase [bacterium]|nr:Gfo/Idh/MocA family oxidoreductase [bacterium]